MDDSSCIPVVTGCIDSLNIVSGLVNVNYNPLANTDDGSCTDTLLGCTDPSAPNYCANVMLMMVLVFYLVHLELIVLMLKALKLQQFHILKVLGHIGL